MSGSMLHGILQMPPELWSNDAIDIAQRHGRYLEASKRITELERQLDWALKSREAVWNSWNKALEERDEARRERDALWDERDEARKELAELKTELARVSQMNQHADKSSVGDSTYVLTQQPCQRVSRVGMETDWTAIGYREGMSAALHSGGIRGAKWHAERKGIQGEAADNYISGFNAALDEYEQEKA